MPVLWMIALLSAAAGGFELFNTMALAKSAPQQAAGAGMALAYAVIPYIAVRAIEGMMTSTWRRDVLKVLQVWSVAPVPAPPPMTPPTVVRRESALANVGMGHCPGCGKLRGTNVATCVYCGSTEPTKPE
jgi:hypothetical protein